MNFDPAPQQPPGSTGDAKFTESPIDATVKVSHDVVVKSHDESSQSINEPFRAGLSVPKFGTVDLLRYVGLIAFSLAVLTTLPPMMAMAVILFGLCVFAHVAGNAVGTKLRDTGVSPKPQASAPLQTSDYAPTTRLSLHKRLGRMTLGFTIFGAFLGATGGGGLLAFVNWENITLANMSLAVLSCSVLGGLFGFWLSSFLQVFLQAWAEAHKSADPDR